MYVLWLLIFDRSRPLQLLHFKGGVHGENVRWLQIFDHSRSLQLWHFKVGVYEKYVQTLQIFSLRGAATNVGNSYDVSMANPETGYFTKKVLS